MGSRFPALLLLLLSSLFAHLATSSGHARPAGRVRVELFHRDYLFNTSLSPSARVRAAFLRSAARMKSFPLSSQLQDSSLDAISGSVSISSRLLPTTHEYLMSLSVGTPPVSVLVAPDSGSDLIWTMCAPCRNCTHRAFHPKRSPTYRRVRCDSSPCMGLRATAEATCGGHQRRTCRYTMMYGDGSSTSGVLSRETFSFFKPGAGGRRGRRRQAVSFPKVLFGCSQRIGGLFTTGLLGLSRGPLSLISQLGPHIGGRFSYCLVPITRSAAASGSFSLGSAVTGHNVVTTPIVSSGFMSLPTLDHLSLLDITVGGVTVRAGLRIGVDSGTAITFLPPRMVGELEAAVEASVRLPRVKDPEGQFNHCYGTQSPADMKGFPDIVFGFDGGASVALKPVNMFVPADEEGVVCLAIVEHTTPLLGYLAQQDFHVGIDRLRNTVSFAPTDCANL